MNNEIEEMKCPYCGHEKDFSDINFVKTESRGTTFCKDFDVTCPVCKKTFIYTEIFELKQAYNNI